MGAARRAKARRRRGQERDQHLAVTAKEKKLKRRGRSEGGESHLHLRNLRVARRKGEGRRERGESHLRKSLRLVKMKICTKKRKGGSGRRRGKEVILIEVLKLFMKILLS